MYYRQFEDLKPFLTKGRVLIIYGPRRVGKTTLLERALKKTRLKYRIDSGDNFQIRSILESEDFSKIHEYATGYDLIAIDEAQKINNIGQALKILVDQHKETIFIATGSSSFDLAQSVGEPLTGRKKTITLYPISCKELIQQQTPFELREELEDMLIFGSYPEIFSTKDKKTKIELILELVDSYLLKDILALDRLKNPKVLLQLVQLLAHQTGQLVSYHELGTQLHLDVKTIARYIDLLEKSFIIFRLTGFSRNLRKEITSKHKFYFYDNGIRNGVLRLFNPLNIRDDCGLLWENFVQSERLKKLAYEGWYGSRYFWRTYDGQEIDLIEEDNGILSAYEMKWSEKKSVKTPSSWAKEYNDGPLKVIHPGNYLEFLV
jgi:predicted AAA+ superfamily ATPase